MPSVDVFNLGLIYDIDIKEEKVTITHTLTSMLCPMADQIQKDIKEAVERVAGEGNVKIILTHTPPFSRDMLSEEAKLILNMQDNNGNKKKKKTIYLLQDRNG